tara:strand:- start:2425 stop:2826 length:402 start_codon:yes stop_codon:yes gene_type:complete
MENNEHTNIKNAASILLLSIANADNNIDKNELKLTKDIIKDFFSLNDENTYEIIEEAIINHKKSTSYFEYAQLLNEKFSYQDKIDFIFCIYEIGYADNDLNYKEKHLIKQIADILKIDKKDLIKIKLEIQKYL